MVPTLLLMWATEGDFGRSLTNLLLPAWSKHWIDVGVLEVGEDYFSRSQAFDADFEVMVDRQSRLTAETPPSLDSHRLPSANTCWAKKKLGDDYVDWLDRRRVYYTPGERVVIDAILADVRERVNWWRTAAEVAGGHYADGRRLGLEVLRSQMTAADYEASNWPEPLPPVAYTHWWAPLQIK